MTPADISPLPLVSVNRSCRSLKLSSRLRQRDGCCEWQFCCRTTATTHQASSNFGCFERSLLLPGIMHHLIRRRSLAALRRISPANQCPCVVISSVALLLVAVTRGLRCYYYCFFPVLCCCLRGGGCFFFLVEKPRATHVCMRTP